jgi:hypothetical protein
MRLFQSFSCYPAYRARIDRLTAGLTGFTEQLAVFFADHYASSHILLPIDQGSPEAFFTNWDDPRLQRAWAKQAGLGDKVSLEHILLAQIEAHRTEVFYTIDPARLDNAFLKRLPGSVRRTIGWRAAPSRRSADFAAYDLIVNNFPSILAQMQQAGHRTAYFAPSYDPAMDEFARNRDRPIDVMFVGTYSRHHRRRASLLEAVAGLTSECSVVMHLELSRLSRWAESPVGRILPLDAHRRPSAIRAIAQPPVFGLDLYRTLSQAKIILNGAIDMAGGDRGNMRCFEAMGTGGLLLSDAGQYPDGMSDGTTLVSYADEAGAVSAIRRLLADATDSAAIANRGHAMVSDRYSKERQWLQFQALAG